MMRAYKRGLWLLLVLVLVVSCVSLTALAEEAEIVDSGTCGDSLAWTLDGEGVLTISGTGAMTSFEEYPGAPWDELRSSIKKVKVDSGVTSIGSHAFFGCDNLNDVVLPESLLSIEHEAFNCCTSLTSVIVPTGVTSIGSHAFFGCTDLTSVTLPRGLSNVGISAFEQCTSLTNVILPDGLSTIGASAFQECTSLTSVTLPEGLTSIESETFFLCESLTSVIVPESVTRIGSKAFSYCSDLASVTFSDGLTSIESGAFSYCTNLTSAILPNGLTSIGSEAFSHCSYLTSITLAEGLTSIGDYAFSYCYSLTGVSLPSSVPSIGEGWFSGCDGLTNVIFPEGIISIGENAFNYCDELSDVYYGGTEDQWAAISIESGNTQLANATIHYGQGCPHNYETEAIAPTLEGEGHLLHTCGWCGDSYRSQEGSIANGECGDVWWSLYEEGRMVICGTGEMENFYEATDAPWDCYRSQIKTLVVECGVTGIGGNAFEDCEELISVTLPEGLTSIGGDTFRSCDSLTSMILPEGLTSIGDYAFAFCGSLTSVNIPGSTFNIGRKAFYWCANLQGIWVDMENSNYSSDESGVLFNREKTTLIQAPGAIIGEYSAPEGLTSIEEGAFEHCYSLTNVILPEGLTNIGESAFEYCYSLINVTLPEGLASIGESAFSSCDSLTSVILPEGLTSIGESAFSNCDSLTSVIWPEGLTSIERGVFSDCDSLINVTLPEGLTSIGKSAFSGCDSLTNVTLPEGLLSVGNGAFSGCDSLTNVTLPEGLTSIGNFAFEYCGSLTSVTLPEGLANVADRAFQYCDSLTSVMMPDGLTSIERRAFYCCGSLTSVTLPEGVTSVGEGAFEYCESLANVILPEGLTSIGNEAFAYCERLTGVTIPGSVSSIGNRAFYGCVDLQGIWVDVENPNYSSDDYGVLYNKGKNTLIQAPGTFVGEYSGPEGLTEIQSRAFEYCKGLTSVVLSEGLTSVGNYAFRGCDSLTSVTLPEGVTSIGSYAFEHCESLIGVTLLEGLTSIGDSAFEHCISLTSATIPGSVSNIGSRAFYGCNNLQGIWVDSGNQNYSSDDMGVLFDKGKATLIQAPGAIIGEYYAPEGLTSIAGGAFAHCESLISVTISESVSNIGSYAFFCCDSLQGIWVDLDNPNYCNDDQGVLFDKGKTELIKVPDAITGEYSVPDGVTGIEGSAFYNCGNLTGINIPKSVTGIGDYAFSCCDNLQGIWVDQENDTYASDDRGVLFDKDKTILRGVPGAITGVYSLPKGVTGIGWAAFKYCDRLTKVILPTGLSDIGTEAFANCNSLDCIVFLGSAPEIRSYAFDGVTAVAYYPSGDTTWTDVEEFGYGGGITWVEGIPMDVPQIQFCYSQKQDSVRVQWELTDGAEGYQMYRSETPEDDTSWKCVKTITSGSQSTYTNQGLTEGVTYYYKVRAYVNTSSGRAYSGFSDVHFMPAAVVFDAAYSNSSFRIRLRWAEVGGCHGYQIWRKDEGGEYRVVKTIGDRGNELTNDQGGTTAYSNVGLTAGAKYTYKMRAFYITEDGGKVFGPYSDEVTVAVQPAAPEITVTSPKAGRARVDWTMGSAADGYQVWMSESPDSGFAIVKSVTDGTAVSYTKYSLESGKTYYFKVRAYAEVDGKKTFGAYSETIAVTVK